jgi:hypothetical protein
MKRRGHLFLGVLLAYVLAAAGAGSAPAPSSTKPSTWTPKSATDESEKKGSHIYNGVRDTGQFLPDTTWLIRVGPRQIVAKEFVDLYFDSYAEYRPSADSLGRLEFMKSLVNREVMALVAKEVDRPLGFEDRAVMREYSQRALSNVLLQRAVLDSVVVTDDELQKVYLQTGYEQRFRQILFADMATAIKVREDLVKGKIGWANAFPKYNQRKQPGELGDLGFITRDKLDIAIRFELYGLKPGEYSRPFEDPEGIHVVQVTERRNISRLAMNAIRPLLDRQVRDVKVAVRSTKLQDDLRKRFGVTYDSANVNFVASHFTPTMEMSKGGPLSGLTFSGRIPAFEPADTARVLARHQGGQLTLGGFLHHYRGIPPILRQPVHTPPLLRSEIDAVVLEPYRAQVALEMGLDKDPLVVSMLENRKERIQVEHLYEDSVNSKVFLSPEQRHKYYKDHITQFVTYPSIRFAILVGANKAASDSLMARLRAGEKPEAILRADSLAGIKRGSIKTQTQNDEGAPYHQQIFEDLKVGQVESYGPDEDGQYVVLNPVEFIQGRQLSYDESERYIDESLQNIESERLLNAFIARHSKRYPIATRPEKLMQLRWIDPASNPS